MVKKKYITVRAYKYLDAISEAINQNFKTKLKGGMIVLSAGSGSRRDLQYVNTVN